MYKTGTNRDQLFFTSFDSFIGDNNDIRVIDAFVDSLNMVELGFKYSSPSHNGNRSYNPRDLLKLYLYGYTEKVRSSRKLMRLTYNNIEVMWLINNLHPDFRTISDFRKDNHKVLKNVLIQFNLDCNLISDNQIITDLQSQDGTKLKAVNSKNRNFTSSKLTDRKKRISDHVDHYLQLFRLTDKLEDRIEYMDEQEKIQSLIDNLDDVISNNSNIDKDKCLNDIKKIQDKLDFLDKIEMQMEKDNLSQVSLTDPDSKLMPNNGKFDVCYNNQVLVDANSHFITNFNISNNPADFDSMHDICSETKEIYKKETLIDITDKGYNSNDDIVECLKDNIIPEVTPMNENNEIVVETDYIKNDVTDDMINSEKKEDIKTCIENGVIPNSLKDKISSIEIKDINHYETISEYDDISLTDNQRRDIAMKEKCFIKNNKGNKVFCPMGEELSKTAEKKTKKRIKFCNKLACSRCKNPCCNSPYKEVEMGMNQTVSYPRNSNMKKKKKGKKRKITETKVIIHLKPNYDLLNVRMQTSEHPHAQMKFWDNSGYLLLKGIEKVTGEVALYYCAYNIRRAKKIIGVDKLVEYFKNKSKSMIPNI